MLRDGHPECVSLLRVGDRELECALRDSDASSSDVDSADLDRSHHLFEPLPLDPAEEVRSRLAVVLEDELCRLDTLVPELLDPAR